SLQESSAETVRRLVTADTAGSGLVEVFRWDAGGGLQPITDVRTDQIPASYLAQSGLRLAERAATGEPVSVVEPLGGGGELIRAAAPVLDGARGVRGVVVVSDYLSGQFAARARRTVAAYEDYQQLRVLQQPLTGVYLSFFLMLTLMILVGATWMGLYVAKRITRPVQTLAAAAQEIGAGHLDHRVVAETNDEFGSLIEAFNSMAGKLSQSRRELEASAVALEERHREVEGRRRYVETILERIATGVVSLDGAGRVQTSNSAADRLLGLKGPVAGRRVSDVFDAPELQPLAGLIARAAGSGEEIPPQEVAVSREERELHLAVMTTPLRAGDGRPEGMVVVFDDVTPLIRAQKVAAWREVARRLAHEIKNPLTPIQLCAERMRRHFGDAPSPTRELVDECTATIVGEVESLKELVDEFSQFARMPPPRRMPTDLHQLLGDVLQLYQGLFADVRIRQVFAPGVPRLSVDPEQMRRVVINLIDNAVEAIGRRGRIDLETHYQPADALVRVVVADDGPGIPAAEREKLFLPYYSTKRRGSGLGLAIVRRIVAEHGGSIEVDDNVPHGTRFSIELPC
ncbi:MAG: HAMP domain-containing protein, partial [Acidobacteria bacterium]|nr:HAMP domain-containing protein [Acidobacteriota bacterium]